MSHLNISFVCVLVGPWVFFEKIDTVILQVLIQNHFCGIGYRITIFFVVGIGAFSWVCFQRFFDDLPLEDTIAFDPDWLLENLISNWIQKIRWHDQSFENRVNLVECGLEEVDRVECIGPSI